MIKANELRIENIIAYGSHILRVTEILKNEQVKTNEFIDGNLEEYEGVPLTPEILERCGFEVNTWSSITLGESTLKLGQTASPNGLPYWASIEYISDWGFTIQEAAEIQKQQKHFDDNSIMLKGRTSSILGKLYHIHQLQNLYFTLTGKELNVTI
jgi:hypothetical protein